MLCCISPTFTLPNESCCCSNSACWLRVEQEWLVQYQSMRQCSAFSCFHGQFEFTKGKVVSPLATQPAKKNDFWLQRERVMLYNRGAVSDVDCPALAAYWWWSIAAHTFYTHTAQSPRMTLAYMSCIFFGSPLCWLIHFFWNKIGFAPCPVAQMASGCSFGHGLNEEEATPSSVGLQEV